MSKVFSVVLKVISGFFLYMVSLLAFVSDTPTAVKFAMLLGFSVPTIVALGAGVALTRFRNWRRDTGVVLLCASGFATFVILSFACLLSTEEFRRMIKPDSLTLFSDYLTGGGVIVGLTVVRWILVKSDKGVAQRSPNHEVLFRRRREGFVL